MLTPQEVSSRAFAKAMMGGYNMTAVDEFLDELTDDYTNLYKENATLKAKLKVLVEKVEEYRATEDSMRATLLSAQKMADSIVREAEEKRDQVLQEAKDLARSRITDTQRELDAVELRLQRGQEELVRFVKASRELCRRQMEFLEQLPHAELDVPAQEAAGAAQQEQTPQAEPRADEVSAIEERVLAAFQDEPQTAAPETGPETASPAGGVQVPPADEPEGDPFASPEEPTRRINLDELKFGRNYNGTGEH